MGPNSSSGLDLPDAHLPQKDPKGSFSVLHRPLDHLLEKYSFACVHAAGLGSVEPSCVCPVPAGSGEGLIPQALHHGGHIRIHLSGLL